jgi:hypothetical protein
MVLSYKEIIFSFTLSVSDITLNEPVFVDFLVHNRLSEIISFDLGHNCKSNFEFTITEPKGSIIHAPKLSEEGLGRLGKISLKPNEKYTQRLVVNEWYQFIEPGDYKIEIKLANYIITQSGAIVEPEPPSPLSIHIYPRNPKQLSQICQNLSRMAIESSNVEEVTEASLSLSHVRDPIAVPYLERGLRKGRLSWQYAIPGLARIANAEAIEVLISIMKNQDPESGSALARFVLSEIKEKIPDSMLKEKIERALRFD